jgi:hypothetical protein
MRAEYNTHAREMRTFHKYILKEISPLTRRYASTSPTRGEVKSEPLLYLISFYLTLLHLSHRGRGEERRIAFFT